MSSINFNYKWDKETYLKAAKVAYDYELKTSRKRYIGFFFIALTQFGVVAALKKGAIGLLLISTFLVVYWYLLRWPIRKISISKAFNKLPNANMDYSIKTDENGIKINSNLIPWSEIAEVIYLQDGFLIYAENNFFFFPATAFKTLEDKNDFAKLAKKFVKSYTKV